MTQVLQSPLLGARQRDCFVHERHSGYQSPDLVLLGTTSLHGSGSSQYNRVRIPASAVGGRADSSLMYHKVDLSVGFGTYDLVQKRFDLRNVFWPGKRMAEL